MVAVAVAGAVFDEQAARNELTNHVARLAGPVAAEVIEQVLANAGPQPAGLLISLLGIMTFLAGATAVFAELQHDLNHMCNLPTRASAVLRIVRGRFWSFAMLSAVSLLLLASLMASATIAAFSRHSGSGPALPWEAVNFAPSLAVTTVLFALLYRFLPDGAVGWRAIWAGAATSFFLFVLGKSAIGADLGRSTLRSAYGAVGSLAVLLVWVYYSAQILYLGTTVTWIAAQGGAARIPAEGARRHPHAAHSGTHDRIA